MTQPGVSLDGSEDRGPEQGPQGLVRRLWDIAMRDTNVVIIFVIINNVLRAGSSVILTRLLMPDAFGIVGILGSITFTAAMVSDLGFQAFVVRHEEGDNKRFLDTVWTVQVIRSLILFVLLLALAEPIAHMFDKPELAPQIATYSATFALDGFASLTLLTALRTRHLMRLSLLETGVSVFQIVAQALLAWIWRDVWALIVGNLLGSAIKVVLSYAMFSNSWRRFALDKKYAADLWHFARYVTGSSIITLILLQADKLLFARFMTLDQFGLYVLAGNLASAPFAFTNSYAHRVLYPAYAQMWREGHENLRELFYEKRRMASLLYCFAVGGLVGCAPLLIKILYDPRYMGAGVYLQILALMPLIALCSYASNETLTAVGRIRATFEATVVKLVGLAIAGPLGFYFYGVMGLVVVVALMEIPPIIFKWVLMHKAKLLDLGQEMLFLGAGAVGAGIGWAGSAVISPFVH